MIRAIFFDVDGTLISHKISDMAESTLYALGKLHEKGILLFLATGRHVRELERLPLHHFPFDGYVTMSGQICYDRDFQVLFSNPIGDEDVKKLAEMFREKKKPLIFKTKDSLYANLIDDLLIRVMDSISTPLPEVREYQGEPLYMASAFGTPAETDAVIKELSGCRASVWHSDAVDIVPTESGKIIGIRKILEHFGLSREEILAIGDGGNDMDMIQNSGLSVAMGNAGDELRRSADYVTTSVDDDGILHALQHFHLL